MPGTDCKSGCANMGCPPDGGAIFESLDLIETLPTFIKKFMVKEKRMSHENL